MLIDWFTVGAQALNFVILAWLLKRFLYKPILNAVDAREKRIATELAEADSKKAEAQRERDEFRRRNEDLSQQRAVLLAHAADEAKIECHQLLDEARKAADALQAKRAQELLSDAHKLNNAIRRRTEQEVFAIARKTLTDLATVSLEQTMSEVFCRRLRAMDEKAKNAFEAALQTASQPAFVRSAFDLPAAQRATIQKAINETFAFEGKVRFETAPKLISGIELTANGLRIAWSISDYLTELEKGVEELVQEKDRPKERVEAIPRLETAPQPLSSSAPKQDEPEPSAQHQ